MNLILCGLSKCGKTTIGKMLAEKLQKDFIDNDRLIEKAYWEKTRKKYSCREIALHDGESAFRTFEREQIVSLQGISNAIIALGGGSLDHLESCQIAKSIGFLIYLKTPPHVIWSRTNKEKPPSYLDQNNLESSFYQLVAKRIPIYEAAANLIIETTNLNEDQVVETILNHLFCLQYGQ